MSVITFKEDCVHLGIFRNLPFCPKEKMGPDGCPENCPFYIKSYI